MLLQLPTYVTLTLISHSPTLSLSPSLLHVFSSSLTPFLLPSSPFLPPCLSRTSCTLQTPTAPQNEDSQPHHNESFLEALKNTEETASSLSLTRVQSPLRAPEVSIERITDYPGHSLSPSQSPGSIRRSSLSVSESSLTSSLTSEGSLGFDASKRPKKRILKKPHGPRKHKSNRVRWNIPEEGGDTLSLESFESSSTASGLMYHQARNSVMESRHNWQEFEENPPPGSTGLTPSKAPLSPLREGQVLVGFPRGDRDPSPLSPPRSPLRPTQRHSSGSSDAGSSSPRDGAEFTRTVSPLQYSMSPPTRPDLQTSTPVQGDKNLRRAHMYGHTNGIGDLDSAHNQSDSAPPTAVPLLKLDHSNLSELEASTLEDRKRSHLFEIPPSANPISSNPHGPPGNITAPPAYSGYIPPEGMAHLCEDDADDYDHLSPVHKNKKSGPQLLITSPTPPADKKTTHFDLFSLSSRNKSPPRSKLSSPPPLPPPTENGTTADYGDSDIDEALNELKDSLSSRGSSEPQSPVSETTGNFFPPGERAVPTEREVPGQVERENGKMANLAVPQNRGGGSGLSAQGTTPKPPPVLPKPDHLRRSKQQQRITESHEAASVPPPLPPKLRKRTASDIIRHPTTQSASSSSTGTGASEGAHLRPPHQRLPDFATAPAQLVECSDLSQEEPGEDAMSSVSNATLVPDPSESSPPNSHSTHSVDQTTPKQRTKFDHTRESGGSSGSGERGGVLSRVEQPSARVPPLSAHVHPEASHPPPTSSSSSSFSRQSWDQWKDSGTTGGTHFAPHPPPPLHNHEPQSYHREQLPAIEENSQPERQLIINVSNSGSDSSLRGASPPDKVSHAVVQTQSYSHHRYSANRERMSSSAARGNQQHPPTTTARVTPPQIHLSRLPPPSSSTTGVPQTSNPPITTTTGGSGRTLPQVPQTTRNPPTGNSSGSIVRNFPPELPRKKAWSIETASLEGNALNRNHRLYHSQRSALSPRTRQRTYSGSKEGGSNSFEGPQAARHVQPGSNHSAVNPRGLQFHSVNSFENPLEEISRMHRTQSPPNYHKAFSQDDQRVVAGFYPGGPVRGGHVMNMRPEFHDTEGPLQRMLAEMESESEDDAITKRKSFGKTPLSV